MQTISFSIAKIRVNLLYHLYLDYEYLEYIYQYLLYLPIVQSILVGGFNSPEKYESQIGSSSQLLVKIKNVPNHQPVHVPSGNLKVGHGKFAMKVGDFSVKHCHFSWRCLITRGQPGSHWENTYENYDTHTRAHTLDDFGDCKSKKPPFSIGNHLQPHVYHVYCAFSKYHMYHGR